MIRHFINCNDEREVFKDFLKYFESQWLWKKTPATISVHNRKFRTTSQLENVNEQLNKKFRKN